MKLFAVVLTLATLPATADTLQTAQILALQTARVQSLISRLENLENSMIGVVQAYSGDLVPAGWFECDGRILDRQAYPKLFAAIGTKWNTFNGQLDPGGDKFRLPNLNGLYLRGSATPAQYLAQSTSSNGLSVATTVSGDVDISHDHGNHSHGSGIQVAWQAQSEINRMWHTDPSQVAGGTCCGLEWKTRPWDTGSSNVSLGSSKKTLNVQGSSTIQGASETRPNTATVKYIVHY